MSKHHIICKSKTLDVPIIITSTISDSSFSPSADTGSYFHENGGSKFLENEPPLGVILNGSGSKFKLDKGFSLDSHYMKSQNSLSSSSTNNDNASSFSSISSSTNSSSSFQFQNQHYLVPPPVINMSSNQTCNINADFSLESVTSNGQQQPTHNINDTTSCFSSSADSINSNMKNPICNQKKLTSFNRQIDDDTIESCEDAAKLCI